MSDLPKLTEEGLAKLRADTPHATIESIGATIKENADPEVIEDLRAYLHAFAAPKMPGHLCLRCEEPLVGDSLLQAIGMKKGGFEWGIAHGHGHCRNCGWPATLYHFIKDRHGKDLMTIRHILLQQHPHHIELRAKKSQAA